ncbi:HAMP domain-containing sensor histidine kinase [Cytobacillus firmus]|uniref:sensor histidine kinase n=1 Tax=Cytobacillus firmus TaxID=1399 RepID=UPI00237AADCB|nr:HAMP domain-containing sensor histidine kinase [Cytobacillus firmus]MDD9313767.1 HAMP domain-containing sensor histidine kinase [Cytobacillus firmus]
MTVKKRLILSNIGMVLLPVVLFLLLEMVIGYVLFYPVKGSVDQEDLEFFRSIRIYLLVGVLVLTNGILTFLVSKSIIAPLLRLKQSANDISRGNLDTKIEVSGKKDELNELAMAFESMRSRLKEAATMQKQYEENQKELIASISHDLKTPLTSIKGYIRGLSDGVANTPEKMERYLGTIEKKADDMEDLISELLLFSKLDLPNVPYDLRELDLASYFYDYLEELRFNLAGQPVSLRLECEPNQTYRVQADREKLNRVVGNIVQNSLKYMKEGKKELVVRLSSKGVDVTVEIQDNGAGVSHDELPHLFDRFYRTDVSRNSATGGSGLGLAIVKKIIEGHGGTVWASGGAGQGLSIFFTLKRGEDDWKKS